MATQMTVPPDVLTMAPLAIKPRHMAAIMLMQAGQVEYFEDLKKKMSRVQCVSCGCKLGEGRGGRKCASCRNEQANGQKTS